MAKFIPLRRCMVCSSRRSEIEINLTEYCIDCFTRKAKVIDNRSDIVIRLTSNPINLLDGSENV